MIDLIDTVYAEARKGACQPEEVIRELLSIDPVSEEAEHIERVAGEFAMEASGGIARIAGAIGIDFAPCKMNCRFCSFGEEWGLVRETSILSIDEIIAMAQEYVDAGVNMVTLRTTEFFPIETICEWISAVRESVEGCYELNLNIGELTPQAAYACYEAGASSAYHVLRMREGVDTPFDPEVRKRSIEVIAASPLKLNTCIEPIGPEHSIDEIAERMAFAISMRPNGVGIMPRVPVKGTPLGDGGMLGREEMRLMVAVLRLAAGKDVRYVTMHPDDALGLEAGTNGFSVERGAIPRDTQYSDEEWKGLTASRAIEMLRKAGFAPGVIGCDPRFARGASWWHAPSESAAFDDEISTVYIDESGTELIFRDGERTPLKNTNA